MNVGDIVQVQPGRTDSNYTVGGGRWTTVTEGAEGVVTRVGNGKVVVRFRVTDNHNNFTYNGFNRPDHFSMWVDLDVIDLADPNAPRARKLGETPEGMIAPNDPGLKWLWEDAAAYAKQRGYCGQYDEIVKHLGIPGRPKNYAANLKVGNVTMTGRYLCQSADEAREMLRKELIESGVLVPDGSAVSVVEA